MNFASAVEKMAAGFAVRRPEWASWRNLRVVRKAASLPYGAIAEALQEADKALHNMDPGHWGLGYWHPLLRDVVADDWEVVEGQG